MSILRSLVVAAAMGAIGTSASGQLIIAHRGASHDAPENTLAAFKLAMEQDADGFEADFYLTSDEQIICFHDKDTKRICGKELLVTQTRFDELRALDVGSWKGKKWRGEKMPSMEEVLAAVPAGKKIFIELKSGPEIVTPLARILASSSLSPEQIVIITFHEDAVAECKKQMPHLKALWLCGYKKQNNGRYTPTVDEVAVTLKRVGADGLDTEAIPEHVDANFLKRLRELGCREFSVWTVDDPQVALFYKRLGAWSITTNRPAYLRERITSH